MSFKYPDSYVLKNINLKLHKGDKLAIARVVYKDSECMILDEPTAALDPYADYEIYKNFSEITECKTLISIIHRLFSCRMCNRVVVMGERRIHIIIILKPHSCFK